MVFRIIFIAQKSKETRIKKDRKIEKRGFLVYFRFYSRKEVKRSGLEKQQKLTL